MGGEMKTGYGNNDYFSRGLLAALPLEDPVWASYNAQKVSADVGFDFVDMEGTLFRALDEVRETREAHEDYMQEADDTTLIHLGDEISDLVFSGVNLGRWQGIQPEEMMSMADVAAVAAHEHKPESFEEGLDAVEAAMKAAAMAEDHGEVVRLIEQVFVGAQHLANMHGFDLEALLRANVNKYLTRCLTVEELAEKDGKSWHDMAKAGEIINYWKAAKAKL